MPKDKLNDGKPVLKGERLSARMAQLADLVGAEHGEVRYAWTSALAHARNAGEWLIEAKWRTGHRTKWGMWKRWLAKEYGIAERTMSLYMQIARHWDDPRIVEARTQDISIESIADFLRALRSEKAGPPPGVEGGTATAPAVTARKMREQWFRDAFTNYLGTLDGYELEVLEVTLDQAIEAFNTDLRMRVEGGYGGEYYKHRQEATGKPDDRIPPPAPATPPRRRARTPKAQASKNAPEV